jgi:hypothetical protein
MALKFNFYQTFTKVAQMFVKQIQLLFYAFSKALSLNNNLDNKSKT